jgi:type III pantothenate kinase
LLPIKNIINKLTVKNILRAGNSFYNNLVIDYGNTLVKTAIFRNHEQINLKTTPDLTLNELENFVSEYQIQNVIASSVRDIPASIKNYLANRFTFFELTHNTRIPIKNLYQTPETLGLDRLSAAVAGSYLFPVSNVLTIDAGTCITYDLIDSQRNYHGGAISPGIQMRFKALHTFTSRLPLVNGQKIDILTGSTTQESILSGVLNGVVAEVEGMIEKFKIKFSDLHVIISGGDADYFAGKLKSNIFAAQNLVLTGLNIILQFNVEEKQKRS